MFEVDGQEFSQYEAGTNTGDLRPQEPGERTVRAWVRETSQTRMMRNLIRGRERRTGYLRPCRMKMNLVVRLD